MLTPEEFSERRADLDAALEVAQPYNPQHFETDDARHVAYAINDNTRANLAVAKGIALLCDLLGPQQPKGTFRDFTRDEDQRVEDERDARSP